VSAAPATHPSRRVPWLFVGPAVAVFGAVLLVPSAFGAYYAFTDWDGLTSASWVGVENFRELTRLSEGRDVLLHTVLLAAGYVVVVNLAGLGLALALHATLKTRHVLRALFFLPVVVSPLVVAYIWKFILDSYGPLNEALGAIGLESLQKPWLGQPSTALWAIVLVMVWQFSGYHMLIYSAGLQGMQAEVQEAALVDGAGPWRRFKDITLPLLVPAIAVSVALSTITAFTVFDQVMALTGGGPAGATETIGTYVYKQAFVNGRYGYSAAASLVLVAAVAALALVQMRALRRRSGAAGRA
jgi:raffinose/stachyose/melibiose transport system permease protein